jgi:hypothetical protein
MFPSEARTAESYVAGLGASGALMASAIVVFIVLVGVVTFNAWPGGGLFGGGGSRVAIDTANLSPQEHPNQLSLVKLLGGPVQPAGTVVTPRPIRGSGGGAGRGGTGGGGGGSTGGGDATAISSGSDTSGGGGSTLGNTVSGTVHDATDTVGGQVDNATNSNLGSTLGNSVNQTVQGVSSQLP